jgi:hypothetical protein
MFKLMAKQLTSHWNHECKVAFVATATTDERCGIIAPAVIAPAAKRADACFVRGHVTAPIGCVFVRPPLAE